MLPECWMSPLASATVPGGVAGAGTAAATDEAEAVATPPRERLRGRQAQPRGMASRAVCRRVLEPEKGNTRKSLPFGSLRVR